METFLRISWPVILGFLSMAIALMKNTVNSLAEKDNKVTIGLGPISFSTGARNRTLIRIALGFLAICFFTYSVFRDYSLFFPKHFIVRAYYDERGIAQALLKLDEKSVPGYKINSNWRYDKQKFFDYLNQQAAKNNVEFLFDPEQTHSEGISILEAKKIAFFVQEYEIKNSRGFAKHISLMPDGQRKEALSEFRLIPSSFNRIRPTFGSFIKNRQYIIMLYEQVVWLSPTEEKYPVNLLTSTKIRYFPYIGIGTTIYFTCDERTKSITPIGYAIYEPN